MAAPLPPAWTEYTNDSGQVYYHNAVTNTTQFHKPSETPEMERISRSSSTDVHVFGARGNDSYFTTPFDSSEPVDLSLGTTSLAPRPTGKLESAEAEPEIEAVSSGLLSGLPGNHLTSFFDSWFKISLFSKTFDVTTADIIQRLKISMSPFLVHPGEEFGQTFVNNPDFYGPFWITSTIVIFLFATSNIEKLVHQKATNSNYLSIVVACCLMYGCLVTIPVILWALGYFFPSGVEPVDLKKIGCAYGYSLTSLFPCILLCLIPVSWFKWGVIAVGIFLSVYFLLKYLKPQLMCIRRPYDIMSYAAVLVGHIAMFLTLQFYFFAQQHLAEADTNIAPVPAQTAL